MTYSLNSSYVGKTVMCTIWFLETRHTFGALPAPTALRALVLRSFFLRSFCQLVVVKINLRLGLLDLLEGT